MTPQRDLGRKHGRTTWVILALALAVCAPFCVANAGKAAAVSPTLAKATRASAVGTWQAIGSLPTSPGAITDLTAFGATGLAVAGADGHIAISNNGGRKWSSVTPGGLSSAVFSAIAFESNGRGIVASGGLLLVTSDWGATWRVPSYSGPGPGSAFNDIALRGALAVAVGDDGSAFVSTDSGDTWQRQASPTTNSMTHVAVASNGMAIAGTAAGEVLVSNGSTWSLGATMTGSITSVAIAAKPVAGDGRLDLFAANGHGVIASDGAGFSALTGQPSPYGAGFATLTGLPDLTAQSWPILAWVATPQPSLLLAGGDRAGFSRPLGESWSAATTGLSDVIGAATPPSQSVVYLLGADGRIVRTMSAGSEGATFHLASRIVVGQHTRMTATVHVGAPGTVRLRERVPGRRWKTVRSVSWASGDWDRALAFTVSPTLTRLYLLDVKYGGDNVVLGNATLVVAPRVMVSKARLDLRVGDVYRFAGSLRPRLPGAEIVLYTDRGGDWRPVSKQGHVRVRDGHTWKSRKFGTPQAETYHLRARVEATAIHGAAWSRIVTVAVR